MPVPNPNLHICCACRSLHIGYFVSLRCVVSGCPLLQNDHISRIFRASCPIEHIHASARNSWSQGTFSCCLRQGGLQKDCLQVSYTSDRLTFWGCTPSISLSAWPKSKHRFIVTGCSAVTVGFHRVLYCAPWTRHMKQTAT